MGSNANPLGINTDPETGKQEFGFLGLVPDYDSLFPEVFIE